MAPRLFGFVLLSLAAVNLAAEVGGVLGSAPAMARDGSASSGSSGSGSGGSGSSGGSSPGSGSSGSPGTSGEGSSGGGNGSSSNGPGSGDGGSNGSGEGPGGNEGSGRGENGTDASDRDRGPRQDGDDGGREAGPRRDHDFAREAVLQGNAVSLSKVLPTVRAKVEGEVLDVTLKQLPSGVLVYNVRVLSPTGEYRSIVVDAKRNRIIGTGQR